MSPEGYRHQTPLTVRFADLDVLGHLNHATYLTYMEQARICYVRDVCGWQGYQHAWSSLGLILAHAHIDYKLPVAFGQAAVVFTRTSRLGGKSFDLEYVLLRRETEADEWQTAATALTTMVAYDYAANQTQPIPDEWREKMTAYEPALT